MKKTVFFISSILVFTLLSSWISDGLSTGAQQSTFYDSLRSLYQRPAAEWPAPDIDSGVQWVELSAIPADSSFLKWANNDTVMLGKLLFFDPRLSRSNQISCSSCHDPDMAWQDGRKISLGNNHLQGSRNTPSLLNVFIQKELFWDGRSPGLSEQAINPIAEHHEMDMQPEKLPRKLSRIKGYKKLFKEVYGTPAITLEQITGALAAFETTIRSKRSKFDHFVNGNYKLFSDSELSGLHIFRTKARCMNCHHGAYFTDLDYHNIGLTYYGRKHEDLGRYHVTGKAEDVGKFKTPSLRALTLTRPWMHNGLFDNLEGVINLYNSGMHQLDDKVGKKVDSLYPRTDPLLKPLNLTKKEKEDLAAFLITLSAVEYKMPRPELPK